MTNKKLYALIFNRGIRLYLLFKLYGKWLLLNAVNKGRMAVYSAFYSLPEL